METPSGAPKEPVTWSDIDLIKRHPSILRRPDCAFVIVDMQEKLLRSIRDRYEILTRTALRSSLKLTWAAMPSASARESRASSRLIARPCL